MTIDQIIDGVIQKEGGYVNHPNDRGGATKYGITEKVARRAGYQGDMRELPIELAKKIYEARFFIAPGYEKVSEIAPMLAEELTDTGVNMGPQKSTKFLQRALNSLNRQGQDYSDISVDGDLGRKTLEALHLFMDKRSATGGEKVLTKLVNCQQGVRYMEIVERNPKQEVFMFGWARGRI